MTQPAQPFPPAPAARPASRLQPAAIVGIVIGVVVVFCCSGTVLLAALGRLSGDDNKTAQPTPTTAVVTTTAPKTAPSEDAGPTAEPTADETPATETIVMPDVTGMNAALAEDKLKALGLRVQFGSADKGDSLVILPANWTVVKQEPKAGTELAPDSLVVLVCTKVS